MYGKFFASTFTGSMMASGADVFAVWGYCIAHCRDSTVELNPKLLAVMIGASEERMQKAIEFLCSPDKASRSKNDEGRRLIKEGEFQYRVPNHAKYRSIRDEEGRREYNRLKQQEHRAKAKSVSNGLSMTVNDSQTMSSVSAKSEAEAEAEAYAKAKRKTYDARAHLLSIGVTESTLNDWFAIRKAKKLPASRTAIEGILKEIGRTDYTPEEAFRECCARGWAGFKADWIDGARHGKNGSGRSGGVGSTIAELTGANRNRAPVIEGTADRVD